MRRVIRWFVGVALVVTAVWSVPAAANHTGIHEGTTKHMDPAPGTMWRELRPRYVRAVFPFDVADDDRDKDRGRLKTWLARINQLDAALKQQGHPGVEPFVVLGARRKSSPAKPHDRDEYKRAFNLFFKDYVGSRENGKINLIGAWNEPNLKSTKISPATAAEFWKHADGKCRRGRVCRVVVGELAGNIGKPNRKYLRSYLDALPRLRRRMIFGIHTYTDVKRFATCQKPRNERRGLPRGYCDRHGRKAPEIRMYLRAVKRPHIWVTEVGAYRTFLVKRRRGPPLRVQLDDYTQCVAVDFVRRLRELVSSRIERVYYYRFEAHKQPNEDRGLVDFNVNKDPGYPRPAYQNLRLHRPCRPVGTAFAAQQPPLGISGHGVDSTDQLMADVNGDGRADAVAYYHNTASWHVALSTGGSFAANPERQPWIAGHGKNSHKRLLGDVTGDRRADAVVYFEGPNEYAGTWWVAPASGSVEAFEPPHDQPWIRGFGIGATKHSLSDVNGDGRADAVAFYKDSGEWWVALANANGRAFDPPREAPWIAGHGKGSSEQGLDDVTGEDLPDAVVIFRGDAEFTGTWWVARGTSEAFAAPKPEPWVRNYGADPLDVHVLDDVDGDDLADAVVFHKPTGTWSVAHSTGDSFVPAPSPWLTNFGANSDRQFVADVNGDDKGDAVVYSGNGTWSVALATP